MSIEDRILNMNRILANLFVIYVKLHRYSWYVKGEQTLFLAKWYDDKLLQCKEHMNQLVEVILILDGQPFATMSKYVKEATIEEATADDETEEMSEQLISDTTNILQNIDELIGKSTKSQADRIMIQTLLPLEHWLLNIRQACQRIIK